MTDTPADASAFPAPKAEAGAERPPRPAATLVVVRDSGAGIEVLLLAPRRARRPQQRRLGLSGRHRREGRRARARGVRRSRRRSGQPPARPGTRRARLLRRRDPRMLRGMGPAVRARKRRRAGRPRRQRCGAAGPWRGALHRGERSMAELCAAEGLHWPSIGCLSQPLADTARPPEALRHALLRRRGTRRADRGARRRRAGRAAVARARRRARAQRFAQVADADAEDARDAGPLRERRGADGVGRGAARGRAGHAASRSTATEGFRPVMPDEPAWSELGRIDPAGHGHGWYDCARRPRGAPVGPRDPRHRAATPA